MKAPVSEEFFYDAKQLKVGSPEHHELMRKAIRTKLQQNPVVLKLLLATSDKKITHILKRSDGTLVPDSISIPGAVFSQILMDLRAEFQELIKSEKKESKEFNLDDYLDKIKKENIKFHSDHEKI